ncbi:helix-turn-helix domain-containing protein [Nocardioides nematodiphilus]|uniref:helix-turn-helix domain-containing protein n=1 Tax=Nocardioides nematodiphilus TaxID=2849669 RepID=UPI001CD9BCA6|nr:helix-turn-helix domain-containing protein [Nocardioides nematodiphilus]MCA1982550.1 helix-turn-helix domain-containing protein [Nocardioides nematodiphilus]
MLTNVATVIYDGLNPFEFGAACEAFGLDRRDDGVPTVDFAVCGPKPQLRSSMGFTVNVEHGLDRVAEADLVVIPAMGYDFGTNPVPDDVREALLTAHARGARMMTLCSGAFTLGEIGLLDGIECTTHWKHTDALQRMYPEAKVIPEVLYVDSGQVVTSAGTAAGLDASLHIWRQEHGAAIASTIARRMVVPPQRDGGQAQFIARAVPECDAETLGPLLEWIASNLDEELSVESLARRSLMSPRTFARRFRDETGATPHAWITRQRVLRAEELLEKTDRAVEWISREVGFANAATLRHHFLKVRGLSPQAYRRRFAC